MRPGTTVSGSIGTTCYPVAVTLHSNLTDGLLAVGAVDATPHNAFSTSPPGVCCGSSAHSLTTMTYPDEAMGGGTVRGADEEQGLHYAHGGDVEMCMNLCFQNSVFDLSRPSHDWCKGFTWDADTYECRFKTGAQTALLSYDANSTGCGLTSRRCYVAPSFPFNFTGETDGKGLPALTTSHPNKRCDAVEGGSFQRGIQLLKPDGSFAGGAAGANGQYSPRGMVEECKQLCYDNSLYNATIAEQVRLRVTPTFQYCSGFDFDNSTEECVFYSGSEGGGFLRLSTMVAWDGNGLA